jgi:glycosyltransferase involved in cell wall biosynthesis
VEEGPISQQSPLQIQDDPRLLALNTIACSVGPGAGGLGRHFDELIQLARSSPLPSFRYMYPAPSQSEEAGLIPVARLVRGGAWLPRIPVQSAYPKFVEFATIAFDLSASRKLTSSRVGFTGFASHSLFSFGRARRLGISHLALVAPNSHVDNLWRQQELARSQYPIDRGWLTPGIRKRTLEEYGVADVIFVSSEYQRSSFVEFGVDPEKLVRIDLKPHPRFTPRAEAPLTDTFQVAYVGRFDLIKGIPALLDAFDAAAGPDWRLTLMGQFSSYGLSKYVEGRVRADHRMQLLSYGDPKSILDSADLYVHPSFEDGFGYAAMEAMAVGVPVVVTDQTGMSEYVQEGVNGSVVPAGNVEALAESMKRYYASGPITRP